MSELPWLLFIISFIFLVASDTYFVYLFIMMSAKSILKRQTIFLMTHRIYHQGPFKFTRILRFNASLSSFKQYNIHSDNWFG